VPRPGRRCAVLAPTYRAPASRSASTIEGHHRGFCCQRKRQTNPRLVAGRSCWRQHQRVERTIELQGCCWRTHHHLRSSPRLPLRRGRGLNRQGGSPSPSWQRWAMSGLRSPAGFRPRWIGQRSSDGPPPEFSPPAGRERRPPQRALQRSQQEGLLRLNCQRGARLHQPPPCPPATGCPKKEKRQTAPAGRAMANNLRHRHQPAEAEWSEALASSKRRGPLSSRLLALPQAARQRPGAPSQKETKAMASPQRAQNRASGSGQPLGQGTASRRRQAQHASSSSCRPPSAASGPEQLAEGVGTMPVCEVSGVGAAQCMGPSRQRAAPHCQAPRSSQAVTAAAGGRRPALEVPAISGRMYSVA